MNILKKIQILTALTIVVVGCKKDDDFNILPSSFNYISFDKSEILVSENSTDPIKIKVIFSSGDLSKDVTLSYQLEFSDENQAKEGVDFTLPDDSGSILVPAGQSEVEIILLNTVDDDVSAGTRSVIFTLNSFDGFLLGKPDDRDAKSVTVSILEDDLFEFGYTSFEEVTTFNTLTSYPRPASSVDELRNIQETDPGSQAPYVSYNSIGNELGFTASFLAAAVSSVENERMGVYNNTVAAENLNLFETTFIDGNQAYISSDLDGFLTLTFDEITGLNSSVSDVVLDIKFYFRTTSWETEDGFVVYFETADGLGEPILSLFGEDVEEVEGSWQEMRIPFPEDRLDTGRLILTMRNGASAETIIIDSISIKGIL